MKLSILIPCYNEKETISELLRRVHAVSLGTWEREVIVVDDGSTDGSRAILERVRGMPHTIVLFHEKNKGKGAALAEALRHAAGDYVIVQDADLELAPEEIPLLLARAERGASAVYGTRNKKENPHPDKVAVAGVWFLTALINFLYGTRLTDVWNGFKLIRRDLLIATPFPAGGFEAEILFTASLAAKGVKIEEVSVSYFPRTQGTKKITHFDGLKTIFLILRHRIMSERNRAMKTNPTFLRRLIPRTSREHLVFWGTLVSGLLFFNVAILTNGAKLWNENISTDYAILAKNVYTHGVFSESLAPPFLPASTRTPLFPVVLGFFWFITAKSWLGAYLGLHILSAFLSLAFFRFAKTIVRSEWLSVFVAAIFALEPVRLYSVISFYPEILLLLFVFVGLIFAHRFLVTHQPRFLFVAAVLWGFTPLVRPVTAPLGILIAIFALAGLPQWKFGARKIVVALSVIILFALPAAPWLMRNSVFFGQIALSSLPEHQLAGVIAPYFMAWKEPCNGCDREAAIQRWREKIAGEITLKSPTGYASRTHVDLTDAPFVRAVALPYITDNLFSFAQFLAPQVVLYPFVDSWRSLLHNVFGIAPKAQFPISFPARLAHGDFSVISETIALRRDSTFYVFIAGKIIAALLVIFSVVGFYEFWRGKRAPRKLLLLLLALFLFFSALAVPTYELRYRIYILPFLALFGAAGIFKLWKRDAI